MALECLTMVVFRTLCLLLLVLAKGCHSQLNVCGIANLNTRIVGGQNAVAGSWPWQVSLQRLGSHFCGGSLINNGWILSAAHCFGSYTASQVTVQLGLYSLQQDNPNSVTRTLSAVHIHPNYNSQTSDNDLSLLQLSSTVTFNNYITPVCLAATGSTFYNGTQTWVTGFGRTSFGGSLPSLGILQEVQIPVIGNRQCNCLNGVGKITNNMVCAGLLQGGKDSCQGDSGGPLVIKQGSQWIQAGIVSFGVECALPGFPGVYTRVSEYQSWINQIITTNQPGFIQYTSSGTNSDLQATCTGLPPVTTIAPTTTLAPVVCGNANLNTGTFSTLALAGTWPWMASLQSNGIHVCGGTLIAQQFVLSSADCFSSSTNASVWTVKLGRINQNGSNPNEVTVTVANITFSKSGTNDVAVLQLSTKPTLSNFIQPICVDLGSANFSPGTQCWAAGWGSGGGVQQTLQQFNTTIVSCGNTSSNSICTEAVPLEQTVRGGSLMCKIGQTWFQAAVLTLPSTTVSTNSSSSTTNSTNGSSSTTNSTNNSNSTTNSTNNSNSTTNSTNSSNSTTNSTNSSNSTTNSTNSSNSTNGSNKILPDVLDRDTNIQVFTKVSSFSSFLQTAVGSFPSNVTVNIVSTTVSSSSSLAMRSEALTSLSVASVLLLSLLTLVQTLGLN